MMQSARRPTIVQLASLAIEHKVPGTMPHRHQPSRFLGTSLLITQGRKARGVAREWSAEPSNHQPFRSPEKRLHGPNSSGEYKPCQEEREIHGKLT